MHDDKLSACRFVSILIMLSPNISNSISVNSYDEFAASELKKLLLQKDQENSKLSQHLGFQNKLIQTLRQNDERRIDLMNTITSLERTVSSQRSQYQIMENNIKQKDRLISFLTQKLSTYQAFVEDTSQELQEKNRVIQNLLGRIVTNQVTEPLTNEFHFDEPLISRLTRAVEERNDDDILQMVNASQICVVTPLSMKENVSTDMKSSQYEDLNQIEHSPLHNFHTLESDFQNKADEINISPKYRKKILTTNSFELFDNNNTKESFVNDNQTGTDLHDSILFMSKVVSSSSDSPELIKFAIGDSVGFLEDGEVDFEKQMEISDVIDYKNTRQQFELMEDVTDKKIRGMNSLSSASTDITFGQED